MELSSTDTSCEANSLSESSSASDQYDGVVAGEYAGDGFDGFDDSEDLVDVQLRECGRECANADSPTGELFANGMSPGTIAYVANVPACAKIQYPRWRTCQHGHKYWQIADAHNCAACAFESTHPYMRAWAPQVRDPIRAECGRCGIVQYDSPDCTNAHRLPMLVTNPRTYIRSICEFLYEARFDDACEIECSGYSASKRTLVTCSDDEGSMMHRPIHYAREHGLRHVHVRGADTLTDMIINIVSAFGLNTQTFDQIIDDYNTRAGICAHVAKFPECVRDDKHAGIHDKYTFKEPRRCKEFNARGDIVRIRKDISMMLPKITRNDVRNALVRTEINAESSAEPVHTNVHANAHGHANAHEHEHANVL